MIVAGLLFFWLGAVFTRPLAGMVQSVGAISRGDLTTLTGISGVGKKTAERMVLGADGLIVELSYFSSTLNPTRGPGLRGLRGGGEGAGPVGPAGKIRQSASPV